LASAGRAKSLPITQKRRNGEKFFLSSISLSRAVRDREGTGAKKSAKNFFYHNDWQQKLSTNKKPFLFCAPATGAYHRLRFFISKKVIHTSIFTYPESPKTNLLRKALSVPSPCQLHTKSVPTPTDYGFGMDKREAFSQILPSKR